MDVSEFVVAALLLELTPGPNMAYLATLSLARGRFPGFVATAGVAFGLSVHAILATPGAGVLIQQFAFIYEVLRWIGVAYLLFLAWEGWQTQAETSPGRADFRATVGPLFWRGFLSNVFNPKSIIFFVSVVPRFVEVEPEALAIPIQMIVLGSLYVGIATMMHATVVMMAAQLKPWLVDGRRRDITRRALSVALALVAVWLAWTTRR
jgi:threonine/homoserine/homoserine lactone efflux protein